jgi:hypothetical protein
MRDLADVFADLGEEIRRLSQTESVAINFVVALTGLPTTQEVQPTGIDVDLDGVRFRRALAYLVRAMARRCKEPGVHLNIEVIRRSSEQLNVSVHVRGFYEPLSNDLSALLVNGPGQYAPAPPSMLGWTERETRIVVYLFRSVGITPLFAALNQGAVSVLLDASCTYSIEASRTNALNELLAPARPVSSAIVSDDPSVTRLTSRADLAEYEVSLSLLKRLRIQERC